MPAPRRAMRKILEVLRLKFEARLSHENIAAATRISKGAVNKYLRRAQQAGIAWPLPEPMDEAQLEALLFPHAAPLVERHAAPDFAHLHQELKAQIKQMLVENLMLQISAEEIGDLHRDVEPRRGTVQVLLCDRDWTGRALRGRGVAQRIFYQWSCGTNQD